MQFLELFPCCTALTRRGRGLLALYVCATTGFLVSNNRPVLADPFYTLDLVASSVTRPSLNSDLSINSVGTVAFTATDSADGFSKLFVSPFPQSCSTPPCSAPISFFGSGRHFNGASINNADPPSVLSADSDDGYYFLRVWQTNTIGPSFTLLSSTVPPTNVYSAFTGDLGLSDNGTAVDLAITLSPEEPALFFYNGTSNSSNGLAFPTGSVLRPQIARTSDDVVANIPIGTATEIVVYNYPKQALRFVAGAKNNYSNLGSQPGISDDGTVVGFYGTLAGANQIDIQIENPADISASPATSYSITDVVTEGKDVFSLKDSVNGRIGVFSRRAAPFLDDTGVQRYYQLITIAFAGELTSSGQPIEGVYTRDILLEARASKPASGSRKYVMKVVAKGGIIPVAVSGSGVGSATLETGFGLSAAIATSANGSQPPVPTASLAVPWIVLTAQDLAGNLYAVRGSRACSIPAKSSIGDYKQGDSHWAGQHLGSGANTIKGKGCLLADDANVMSFFEPKLSMSVETGLNPGNLNRILKGQRYSVDGSGNITVPSATGDRVIGFSAHNDVQDAGLEILSQQLAKATGQPNAALTAFRQNVKMTQDGQIYDFVNGATTVIPTLDPNLNSEPLSPVTDFFECNQQPVITRVANCNSVAADCHEHYVTGRAKAVVTFGGSSQNTSESINDPAFALDPPVTDLINTFPNKTIGGTQNRYNRVLGVRALTNLPIAGSGNNKFSIVVEPAGLVTLLLSDHLGRQIGILPSPGAGGVSTIPNADYENLSISDPVLGTLQGSDTEIMVGSPINADGNMVGDGDGALVGSPLGDYTLSATGVGTGTYTIQIFDIDSNGTLLISKAISQATTPGRLDTYNFTRTAGGLTPPLVKVPH